VLLVRPDDEEGARVVKSRPTPDEWSALEHAAHAADVADAAAEAVYQTRITEEPQVSLDVGAPQPGHVDDVVARVKGSFERLAQEGDAFRGDDWGRAAQLSTGETVTALDLVRHAVHVGAHHRREVERVIDRVRAT
jgi:hypothetical protein